MRQLCAGGALTYVNTNNIRIIIKPAPPQSTYLFDTLVTGMVSGGGEHVQAFFHHRVLILCQ